MADVLVPCIYTQQTPHNLRKIYDEDEMPFLPFPSLTGNFRVIFFNISKKKKLHAAPCVYEVLLLRVI